MIHNFVSTIRCFSVFYLIVAKTMVRGCILTVTHDTYTRTLAQFVQNRVPARARMRTRAKGRSVLRMQSARALGRVRGVLLDLSGTLHVESTPTPSAVAALNRYRDLAVCIVDLHYHLKCRTCLF